MKLEMKIIVSLIKTFSENPHHQNESLGISQMHSSPVHLTFPKIIPHSCSIPHPQESEKEKKKTEIRIR